MKCPSGWSTSWNQDCWEKYHYPQICRSHHSHGRNWKGTKEPLDKCEIGEWNIWFKLHIQRMKIMAFGPITSLQIDGETMERVRDFNLGVPKIIADDDYNHESKRCLLIWRKTMTHLYNFLKVETLFCWKFQYNQSYDFSSCHVWMWQLHHKEWWAMNSWWFWTLVLDKSVESALDCKETHPVILKEINPEYSLERPMLKLNLQYFGQLMWKTDSLEKTLLLEKIEGRRRRGGQRMRWLDGITNLVDMSCPSSRSW